MSRLYDDLGKHVKVSMYFLALAVGATIMGILIPGIWWILWLPLFLAGAFVSGTALGWKLGLIPLMATILAVLGFTLDFVIMPSGLWSSLLKAAVIFILFSSIGTQGWFYMERKLDEAAQIATKGAWLSPNAKEDSG